MGIQDNTSIGSIQDIISSFLPLGPYVELSYERRN